MLLRQVIGIYTRFNPQLKNEGKNPFILDSKEPTASFRDFIMSENSTLLLPEYSQKGQKSYLKLQRRMPEKNMKHIRRCQRITSIN
jgi:pyruvate-ferredoxin/flavodoxin oxidoreductase